MAGATIDHMVSVTILIAAMLVAMTTYNGLFASAVDYDRNRQVANKAVDIMNTICLSPGNPVDWGETNASVLGFGLQDSEIGGYNLSPYSIMRLRTSIDTELVEYPLMPGVFYNNLSGNFGNGILNPISDCINYSDAAKLLGVDGSYGFSIDILPTLDVTVLNISQNPLKLDVSVKGSGIPLSGASLNYCLFYTGNNGTFPMIVPFSGVAQTNASGSVELDFSVIKDVYHDNTPAYSILVYAGLGGITGVGYHTHRTTDMNKPYIIPLIYDYDEGEILIAHNWDGFTPEVKYYATFYILTADFQFQELPISNSTEHLNYGKGFPFFKTQLPVSEVGVLVISYRKSAQEIGSIIMPWGGGVLGLHPSFSGGIAPSGYSFVATELRQVNINGISYQVKVSTWSLRG